MCSSFHTSKTRSQSPHYECTYEDVEFQSLYWRSAYGVYKLTIQRTCLCGFLCGDILGNIVRYDDVRLELGGHFISFNRISLSAGRVVSEFILLHEIIAVPRRVSSRLNIGRLYLSSGKTFDDNYTSLCP